MPNPSAVQQINPTGTSVKLDGNVILTVPNELVSLVEAIEKSKYLLAFKDNWDEEGAKKYAPKTWIKAAKFIGNYATWLWHIYNRVIATPQIYHGPDGSIDIYWKTEQYNFLINIPEDKKVATFYGDDYGDQGVEGFFPIENFKESLLPNLMILN